MTNCKNCEVEINGYYCSKCGQPAKLKRIDKHYISQEVLQLLGFEKGFSFTAKELINQPGKSIREFIIENRSKHVKPIAFLILASLLYTLIAHFFHTEEIYNGKAKLEFGKSSVYDIEHWVQTNYGYANILMGIFIALCVKITL